MPNTSGFAVKVGIFVVVALVLLIGFSLQVGTGLGGDGRYKLHAYFDEALGLNDGADVSIGGVAVGEVANLSFDGQRRQVHVVLEVNEDYALPEDSVAKVEKSALLGSAVIVVQYGQAQETLEPGSEIATATVPGLNEVMAQISEMSGEAKELLSGFKESQGEVFGKLEQVIEENREDIKRTTESMAEAGPKLQRLADELTLLTEDLRSGRGTMGKLFTDETLYNDLKNFSTEARQLTQDIREGEGSLSRLVYDDALVVQAEEALAKVSSAGDELQQLLEGRGESLDEALRSISQLGPRLNLAMEDVKNITSKINEGDGTLGKLVNDPGLYQDTQRAVNQVTESFEQSEEQGVIRSFFGLLFGALI